MPDIIRLLPDNVANQIAAGEVIQRPASAVKELLENAIDAKASEVKLFLKEAGRTLVQVVDNGIGMSPTDARLAFERHATSKIRIAEDLFSLHTKGFRGEALASIAAVAQVELITCQEGEEVGTSLLIEGNKIIQQQPVVTQKGTSIAMKNLFFNIPARRNFLKSDTVEYRHILDEFHRVALAHPNIYFSLHNNDQEQIVLPATTLQKRIVQLFGSKLNERLVPVEELTDIVRIHGYVCKGSARKNKSLQFFIVNDRFIRNRYLHHAVTSAFEGLLKEGEQPEYFLYLELDPKHIDINIHPTKTEIKFDNDQAIYTLLRSAIKHSLGQFHIFPTIDFSLDESNEVPYSYKDREAKTPTYQVDRNFNPFQMTQEEPNRSSSFSKKETKAWESLYSIPSSYGERIPSKANESLEEDSSASPLLQLEVENKTRTILYFQRKYIITYLRDKILIINAPRAHQRILYERYYKRLNEGKSVSQSLLFPLEFEFSSTEILTLEPLIPLLNKAGFLLEIRQNIVSVTGLPSLVKESQVLEILHTILEESLEGIPQEEFSQQEALAKDLARSLSLKAGQSLSLEEQEQLVSDLFSCTETTLSPFGKRIYTSLTLNELEGRF
ncbi:DNA mismatch repair endonuclease MutL [uncultured Capnocytophaga sp.]|jgi:DNA mismatch repair protein mutL|uniref:DNA mismatch repair endonuclease MutL n=1 Tax=uncultured Capnocytophaga sp. TaxID=159273 RepID=UPI00260E975C|nr:DNA mismatch repair endonuclease MutL [uncultured Capnocytophaga sp.]